MKQVELRLIPAPGQKPEFLAVVELVHKQNVPELWEHLPPVVVLEGYTRDAWASDTSTQWTTWQVESIDGRNKLPGFVKFLRDRQKSCYGRVVLPPSTFIGADQERVWVISHKQMSSSTVNCRIASIHTIPTCPLRPMETNKSTVTHPPPSTTSTPASASTSTSRISSSSSPRTIINSVSTGPAQAAKPKRSGLLGNLVGAQRRTNTQLEIAASVVAPKKKTLTSASTASGDETTTTSAAGRDDLSHRATDPGTTTHTIPPAVAMGTQTAGQVLADFRSEMEQKMLDFDIATEESCLKINLDLAAKLRLLMDEEKQSGRVTMEVLKYIVYEQAEEVNEEWIAHKEPSEFMDEVVIAIYKEGEAPEEVLEEMNKGELPDEVRGQQRAIQEQLQKAEQIKAQKIRMEQMKLAMQLKTQQQEEEEEDEDFAALNTQKRDRRTIEDYEREAKRRRGEE